MAVRISYLRTILRGETHKDFDEIMTNKNGTSNAQLKEIQKGLLGVIIPDEHAK